MKEVGCIGMFGAIVGASSNVYPKPCIIEASVVGCVDTKARVPTAAKDLLNLIIILWFNGLVTLFLSPTNSLSNSPRQKNAIIAARIFSGLNTE